jgi:hypothetical protein
MSDVECPYCGAGQEIDHDNNYGFECNDLLARFGDREEWVYSVELHLLRKIAETSSDMVQGLRWPEFREAAGGQEKLDKAHESALDTYQQWLSDGDG